MNYLWQKTRQYVSNVGRASWVVVVQLDKLLNALTGGDWRMTVSGRMGRAIANGNCRFCGPVCKALNWFDKDHCVKQAQQEMDLGDRQVTGV